ncbi:hypothetical protein BATDEDRAFT_92239 [Batrachochytrium dendrobatidis JAM81]|uniref:Uncharacterized protein n=2 Tax=Batrachochytrium dendrobatidis TaxID=109871 RepID=F4PCP8_BATDJ|nr:uncharacterized protein BATDEDRAFT_92239 [Batrachochytrium dendrobatidis JAM81]EGF76982.1 hypothetical protein BATDEDRAFT_92239 [Batrachochytrium dendrobatidis JAM81]KAJ8330948.1 hypothetical protein O5D80_000967 [Batrachochytrium dendrobatidis]KAK5672477.1 hypothetical protein QVD99_001237 [Batrachochytrium dendrobatidis]OAJ44964.1 hypothetical protein BDEG_28139 [Batrachochytrium dendrobatidis JEL423]|eukprot:XP_006682532.1 hypothetical protein BATDEDRAFT_92239 [Batrachochytrium dendrobatidis JAM81]
MESSGCPTDISSVYLESMHLDNLDLQERIANRLRPRNAEFHLQPLACTLLTIPAFALEGYPYTADDGQFEYSMSLALSTCNQLTTQCDPLGMRTLSNTSGPRSQIPHKSTALERLNMLHDHLST